MKKVLFLGLLIFTVTAARSQDQISNEHSGENDQIGELLHQDHHSLDNDQVQFEDEQKDLFNDQKDMDNDHDSFMDDHADSNNDILDSEQDETNFGDDHGDLSNDHLDTEIEQSNSH